MEPINESTKQFIYPLFLVAGFCVLIVGIALVRSGIISQSFFTPSPSAKIIQDTSQVDPNVGSFTVFIDPEKKYRVGNTVKVLIKADSKGEDVQGYDVVLLYSGKAKFLEVKNLLPDFEMYVSDDRQKVSVTSPKKLTGTSTNVFKSTDVLEFSFKLNEPGVTSFTIESKKGSRDESNMFGIQNIDLLGAVKNAQIIVNE